MTSNKLVNFTIFGPAHSGKSTLAGYILAHYIKKDMDKFEREMQEKHGNRYEPNQLYAYLLDRDKDETDDDYGKSDRAASKKTHIQKCSIPDIGVINIIDTPGVERFRKNRQLGVYYGDVGIFCMELKDVLAKKTQKMMIADQALANWVVNSNRKAIVLLTKSDAPFDDSARVDCFCTKEQFETAKNNINYFYDINNYNTLSPPQIVHTLPIAIQVSKRSEHNVFSKSDNMNWYSDETLLDTMKRLAKDLMTDVTDKKELLFSVSKEVVKPKGTQGAKLHMYGRVFLGKIINGQLNTGDFVRMCPVFTSGLTAVDATIKAIRFDIHKMDTIPPQDTAQDTAYEGDIVSIDIDDYTCDSNKIDKNLFKCCKAAFVLSPSMKYTFCDRFEVIFDTNMFLLEQKKRNCQFEVIWFGHTFPLEMSLSSELSTQEGTSKHIYAKIKAKKVEKRKLVIPEVLVDKSGLVPVVITTSVQTMNMSTRLFDYYSAKIKPCPSDEHGC